MARISAALEAERSAHETTRRMLEDVRRENEKLREHLAPRPALFNSEWKRRAAAARAAAIAAGKSVVVR